MREGGRGRLAPLARLGDGRPAASSQSCAVGAAALAGAKGAAPVEAAGRAAAALRVVRSHASLRPTFRAGPWRRVNPHPVTRRAPLACVRVCAQGKGAAPAAGGTPTKPGADKAGGAPGGSGSKALKPSMQRLDPSELMKVLDLDIDVRPLQECSVVPPVRLLAARRAPTGCGEAAALLAQLGALGGSLRRCPWRRREGAGVSRGHSAALLTLAAARLVVCCPLGRGRHACCCGACCCRALCVPRAAAHAAAWPPVAPEPARARQRRPDGQERLFHPRLERAPQVGARRRHGAVAPGRPGHLAFWLESAVGATANLCT